MDQFKRAQGKLIGVGGVKCRCCNDFHGQPAKPRRFARRALKAQTCKVLREVRNA